MVTALTFAELEQLRSRLTLGTLANFYEFMGGQGYNYAYRAEGILKQDTLAGAEAYNFLLVSAQQQGVTLNQSQINTIELQLANGWITALEAVAQDATNTSHTVSADLNFQQTLTF